MYIRYQHVRNGLLALGAVSLLGCCGFWGVNAAQEEEEDQAAAEAPRVTATRRAPTRRGAPASSRVDDARILALADGQATPKGKLKDALPGAVKVNIYEDTGDTTWDRIKIDRDRDDTWDDQWVRKSGVWTRDDGRQRWTGSAWEGGEGAKAPTRRRAADSAPELADLADLLLHQRATTDKIKDLKRGAGPKINVYDDDKNGTWDRAKVDHNRDDAWDESWTVKGGQVERKLESSGKVLIWSGGSWKAK